MSKNLHNSIILCIFASEIRNKGRGDTLKYILQHNLFLFVNFLLIIKKSVIPLSITDWRITLSIANEKNIFTSCTFVGLLFPKAHLWLLPHYDAHQMLSLSKSVTLTLKHCILCGWARLCRCRAFGRLWCNTIPNDCQMTWGCRLNSLQICHTQKRWLLTDYSWL